MSKSEIDELVAKHKSQSWSVHTMSRAEQMELPKGKIAIVIDKNGEWFYQGGVFNRPSMVLMLSRTLIKMDDKYFLITPEQRLEIDVEDLPFVTSHVALNSDQEKIEVGISNGDQFEIDSEHPLLLQKLPDSNQKIPIIKVRDDLFARFSRACYYQLADWSLEQSVDGQQCLCVKSNNIYYSIGTNS